MELPKNYKSLLTKAWQGRISGCMLGKAVEIFSMREGQQALHDYLEGAGALPLRDYIPYQQETAPKLLFKPCCKQQIQRSEPDDDINYSVLALMLLEQHGAAMTTTDVARAWLKHLPLASTFTAERAAYKALLERGSEWFPEGRDLGFDINQCADNPYNDWIGAQIRADVYGWVCPGNPELAAQLAEQDASLSHKEDGVYGAVWVAVMGALLSGGMPMAMAIDSATRFLPAHSRCAEVLRTAIDLSADSDGGNIIRRSFGDMSVVHTVNNLGLVAWALLRYRDDFSAAIGEVVTAGLDTDCNGATVGALWALQDKPLPDHWPKPWQDRVGVSLAGQAELSVENLVERTLAVAEQLFSRKL